ncbi:MAG: antibiotic biosynthesis monooxygenase [Burkholderiales bacterium]|nr:antibiotic biosynthesis monooxygenase [Burkholderiales bacterium]
MKYDKSQYIVCIAKLIVKKDKLVEALEVFAKLNQISPQEPGCLRYELHQDMENPLIFTFIDRFKDNEAFEFHCAQEYTVNYFDNILPNLVDSMEITTHHEVNFKKNTK